MILKIKFNTFTYKMKVDKDFLVHLKKGYYYET